MNRDQVDQFRRLELQLTSLHEEVGAIAKKKPDDKLNQFKIELINELVTECNEFLGDDYAPFREFRNFDDTSLPSASDVMLVLGQYLKCFDLLLRDNVRFNSGRWFWILDDGGSGIEARRPVY